LNQTKTEKKKKKKKIKFLRPLFILALATSVYSGCSSKMPVKRFYFSKTCMDEFYNFKICSNEMFTESKEYCKNFHSGKDLKNLGCKNDDPNTVKMLLTKFLIHLLFLVLQMRMENPVQLVL